ncbi:ecdysteroid-phosphate phosphatase [Parasteatoda tepidariorum]|uniref:ecdysteroid-phosphate phosphatase n=1 Tax=Parasteatoda tepidariorum TaxID=114398 RepID=UPI000A2C0BD8|nr:protein UBASH3A homolog [Parasteatoda tepidariorum]XP_042906548.1 protein UBASH3A homolog [Parasteatoda tepidariorum]
MGDMHSLRKLYIMRHAERVDFCFGSWIPTSFDKQDNYIRRNLNMPLSVPKRKGGPWDFFKDCPLTRMGLHQATLTGEAMKLSGVKFSHVFCSPSLRCLETCTNVLKASEQTSLPINVEPGLFEWLGWYVDGMPKWMTLEEMSENGFKVTPDYKPIISMEDMHSRKESSEEYYMRNYLISKTLIEKYSGDILLVAHAASLDTCSRQLTGKPPRNEKDLLTLVPKFSYASVALVEQDSTKKWHIAKPPFPPLMHLNNISFNWEILLD